MGKKIELRPCTYCGTKFDKEKIRCTACKQWNIEPAVSGEDDGTFPLGDADDKDVELVKTGEWDRVFGRQILGDDKYEYGIPKSSVTLLGGKNGAGKSTLVMQICEEICAQSAADVLIVSVEEAAAQVKRLGKRLGLKHMTKQSKKTGCIRISKGDRELAPILHYRKPSLIVVDSLPRLCPDMADAVEFCKRLKGHVEDLAIPAIVINHINKEEEFAGLESLQHEVDATLIFTVYDDEVRELSSKKNRNAPLTRVLFNMTDTGLVVRKPEEDEEDEDEE